MMAGKPTPGLDADSVGTTRTRIISQPAEWQALNVRWRDLWTDSPSASPPLRWEWLWTWWRVFGDAYGAGGEGLRVAVAERNGRLVAALPLYVARRSPLPFAPRPLQFISTGEDRFEEICPQYMNVLYRRGEEDAIEALLEEIIGGCAGGWDQLNLVGLPADSLLNRWRVTADRRLFDIADANPRPSYVADLSGGFEAYLQRLSANTRAQARRLLRAVKSQGVSFELCTTTNDSDAFYNQLIALHQVRWNQAGLPGVFSSQRFTEFHRSLARELMHEGTAILARLTHQGEPLAVLQGYLHGSRFYHYLSGARLTEQAVVPSPGIAAHLCLKHHLAERGITEYDYLPGASRYKEQYSTDHPSLCRLTADRRSLRLVVHRVAMNGARATRRLVKSVRNRT